MDEFKEAIASGLRNMSISPDYFVFTQALSDIYGNTDILGFTIIPVSAIYFKFDKFKIPILPAFKDIDKDTAYHETAKFLKGYLK